MRHFLSSTLFWCVLCSPPACSNATAEESVMVNAGTSSDKILLAPSTTQSFDFVVFGDHKGGPHDSVIVLGQAVEMTNNLDPDFVMTVGDLVEGYNKPDQWVPQMQEFTGIMNNLQMPWFPVPGNHDVYARPNRPGGNTDLYKQYFGPLYYSFDYKWAHFIVLFSDEAGGYHDPSKQQNISTEQFDWLRRDLAATDAQQIYVFLHHPRWIENYEGCNWPEVHQTFVNDGRETVVFGGHIHQYRFDGKVDNISYYALATTGGGLGRYRQAGAFHHINLVRARPDGYSTVVIPVGSVYGGDFVLGSEVVTMKSLSRGRWLDLDGRASISLEAGEPAQFNVTITNPIDRRMHFTGRLDASEGWKFDRGDFDFGLEPGKSRNLKIQAKAPALTAGLPKLRLLATAHYQLDSGLLQPIEIRQTIPIDVIGAESASAATPDDNGVLSLDGTGAIHVNIPEKLNTYTIECWVKGHEPKGRVGLIAKTESSAYGIFWSPDDREPRWPTGYVGTTKGYLSLTAANAWDWAQWTHLALSFDGERAAFFVNGKLQDEQTTDAKATHNNHPFYIGADTSGRGEATSHFVGMIDEVRISDIARYGESFTPAKVFTRDENTVLLLHFDKTYGPASPDDSGRNHHGWPVGEHRLERVAR